MMTGSIILVLSSFLACGVEAVEALTVILAVGVTRGWRAALIATGAATSALTVLVLAFGPTLSHVPIGTLRVVVGTLLLVFGMGWLRKAILRATGYTALRDESALYEKQVEEARKGPAGAGGPMDWYGFTLVFKSVFLEGLEVAFIVLTFGSSQHSIPLATLGAVIALVSVAAIGLVVHRPLSRVPENAMKFAVGLMLCAFGIFWSVEGAGAEWPGADLSILGILGCLVVVSFTLVVVLRRIRERQLSGGASAVR
jgi:uncharacterized membrane protein